jgi:hypothetical protein
MHFMKNNFSILFVTLVCLSVTSCSPGEAPKMSKGDLSKLYARLMLLSETYPTTSDSLVHLKKAKTDSLFGSWGTTENGFREIVSFYQQTEEDWKDILRMAAQEIDSLKMHPGR